MKNYLSSVLGFAIIAAAATPAMAESIQFSQGGEDYVADVTTVDNVTKIVGQNRTTKKPFRLTVKGSRVRGTYNGTPVAFMVSESALAFASR